MVTGPDKFKGEKGLNKVSELIGKIEQALKDMPQLYDWVEVVVTDEYSKEIRAEVAKEYLEAGWSIVYHQTSSENGERPGLTAFALLDEETCKTFESCHDISKWVKWVNCK